MDTSNTKPYYLPADAVFFITGCSSGIGRSLANYIATKTTHRVVATARNLSTLSAPSIPDGPNVLKLSVDVVSSASINSAISTAFEKFGRIDVVVNNAGYNLNGDTEAASDEDARRIVETNFWGGVNVFKAVMPIMREKNTPRGGVFLNVTSMGGFVGYPGNAFYHSSKFAMEGFTESVAKEMHPDWNIHFALIEPGGVKTNYATVNTVNIPSHPAYTGDDMPANILKNYVINSDATKYWADPDDVAHAMYTVVSRGQRIPLRVPLGPDAWGMLRAEVDKLTREFEEIKDLSLSVGSKDQLASIDFLKKKE